MSGIEAITRKEALAFSKAQFKDMDDQSKEEKSNRRYVIDIVMKAANKESNAIDLHFMTPKAALALVISRITKARENLLKDKMKKKIDLQIITGRGKSTDGKCVIKHQIIKWLKDNKYKVYPVGEGMINVTIR